MRFVDSLKEITLCPNCRADTLLCIQNPADMTQSKFCPNCREEIFESAQTIDDKDQEKKEMEFFELRELIDSLRYHVKTVHEEGIITCLQTILNKMTDIIERKEQ